VPEFQELRSWKCSVYMQSY